MEINVEFVTKDGEDHGRGVLIQNVLRFEVTLRRSRMYFRAICDGGVSRTYDYSEIKRIMVSSADNTKGLEIVSLGDVR